MKTIALANQKGGVGKTTTAINLAAALVLAEYRVLLIDLDSQANASSGFGVRDIEPLQSSYRMLVDPDAGINDLVVQEPLGELLPGLGLIPSCQDIIGAEIELADEEDKAYKVSSAIGASAEVLEESFDFLIIDCPPSLGVLTLNALCAADSVLVPVQAEYYALEGVSRLWQTISLVREKLNPELSIEGVVITMADMRTTLARQVDEELRNYFKDMVFDSWIPRSVRLAESPSFGMPSVVHDPTSVGSIAYFKLAVELLNRNGLKVE